MEPAAPIPSAPAPRPTPAPEASSPMVAAAKASPAADSFDFDFGFDSNPPTPTDAGGGKATETTRPVSDDPIADLIAADLDTEEAESARSVQPAPRNFGMPSANTPAAGGAPAAPAMPVPFRTPPPSAKPTPSDTAKPEDRFGVAPVFGPTGRSQISASARAPERDPMEEIESLIGEAVRVELTSEKPAPTQAAPAATQAARNAPVVPPLTTGLPPRRATIPEPDDDMPSADVAILAAAAQGGGDASRLDSVSAEASPFIAAEASPYKRVKAKPERRPGGMRQYVGIAVAGTLLLAAGFGLYWVIGMGTGSDAEAPVLQADATPVKEAPPPTPTSTATPQGAVVFNELEGGNATPPADEQLVSRDDSAATSVADVARTVGDGPGAGETELANRKVRTVTVRPDGTIVSGDDAVAGSEELPVDRPNVPQIAGAETQPSELLASIPSTSTALDATSAQTPLVTDTTELAALAPTDVGQSAAINPNIVAPVPLARPTNRSALASGAATQTATTQPAAPAQQAAPVASGSGPYVQLSSQPNQNAAQSALNTTQSRLSNLLAGRSLAIRSVDLGARGTWYRVVLPVSSFQEATQTCASLKANGVDCVPIGG